MLYAGFQNKQEFPNINKELAKLEGYLDDDVAKESLVKFFQRKYRIGKSNKFAKTTNA